MPQSDYQVLLKSQFYPSACALLCCLTIVAMFTQAYALGIVSALLCGMLLVSRKALSTHQTSSSEPSSTTESRILLKWGSLGFACLTLIAVMSGVQELIVCLYAMPLLVFFFFEFKPALLIIALLTLVTILVLSMTSSPMINIQFISTYAIYLGISGALVYLREVRRKQLKPLRRTDNLTQAATREHLDDDLRKEIQRSEREGSDLALMALGIDEKCLIDLSPKQRALLSIDLGKLLHNNLRVFDSYYLWNDEEFLVVLPHTSSSQANKIANELRLKVRKQMSSTEGTVTISAGIIGLNVGDDGETLTRKTSEALRYSMRKGSNRTQIYREENSSEETRGTDSNDAENRSTP